MSSNWHQLPRAAFDVETTGRDPMSARIVTASVVVVNGRQEIIHHLEWLVDPGVPIPEEATAVHGVSTQRAQSEGVDAAIAVAEISSHLRDLFQTMPVVAFNASFDCLPHWGWSQRPNLPQRNKTACLQGP